MQYFPDGFDPVSFLNIKLEENTSTHDLEQLKRELVSRISEYTMIKLTNSLSEDHLSSVLEAPSAEEKFKKLNEFIPDLSQNIDKALTDFKKEFNNG